MDVIEAMKMRISCRTYGQRAVEAEKISALREFLAANIETPFGGKVRFLLLDFDEPDIGELKDLTTYGVIKGARQFIVGAVEEHPLAMEDFGFCMEKNILQATAMGLGTCWLGGTFKRSGFAEKIDLGEGELLPVISPVGYPAEKRAAVDRLFRFVAASDRRKPWQELFHLDRTGNALDREAAGPYETCLECVRLAPSASNKQPWRIVRSRDPDAFHFYLRRTSGYENLAREIKLQNIDMGIALCHFASAAAALGLRGDWTAGSHPIPAAGGEYIASWIARDRS